jgi:hypothetical protein
MSEVMLSVPFVVTSTKLGPQGEVEKHVLTPFGDLDIIIHAVSMKDSVELVLDIHMGDGADRWLVVDPTFVHFRETLVRFVRGLLEEILGDSRGDVARGRIHFRGRNGEFLFLDLLDNESTGLPTDSARSCASW